MILFIRSVLKCFFILLYSLSVIAAEDLKINDSNKDVKDNGKQEKKVQPQEKKLSSREIRATKSYQLTGEIGFSVGMIPSLGITGAFFLSKDSLIQTTIAKGTIDYIFLSTSSLVATVDYKYFIANSFYVRGGPGIRRIEFNDRISFLTTSPAISNTAVFGLAVGNQWQWKTFTLGCDWFGILVPFSTIESKYEPANYAVSSQNELKNNWNNLATTTTYQSLRFYLGMSF